MILQTAGGRLSGGLVEAGSDGFTPKTLSLRLAKLKQVLGIDVPPDQVVDALGRDHLSPVLSGDRVDCVIPSYRLDLNIEVDLVEEVARIIGYDTVPVRDQISVRLTQPDPAADAIEVIRSTLIASGYFESVTFSFVSDALARDFVPADASRQSPLMRVEHTVRKADAHLRPSILPGLLESIRHNESAGVADPRLFEIGSTFWNDAAEQPVERRRVALIGVGEVSDVRGVVQTLLNRLNTNRPLAVIPDTRPGTAQAPADESNGAASPSDGLEKSTVASLINSRCGKFPLPPSLTSNPCWPECSMFRNCARCRSFPRFGVICRWSSPKRCVTSRLNPSFAARIPRDWKTFIS